MSCNGSLTNIQIRPMDLTWEIEDQWIIECIADVSQSLENQYFNFYTALDATRYYVWFEVGGGGGTDPAIAGATGVKVSISTNATASAVATAVKTSIDALAGFVATVDGECVTVTCVDVGACTPMTDGAATTGFTFTQTQVGASVYLGLLDGDIVPAMNISKQEIQVHQTGPVARTTLLQGVSATIPVVLKESHLALKKDLIRYSVGDVFTPSGGTEIFGMGSSKNGTSMIKYAKRLICHPYNNAANDYTYDLCFWKALPIINSMTFSGENPATMEIEFMCFKDEAKDEEIDLWMMGNWTQTNLIP